MKLSFILLMVYITVVASKSLQWSSRQNKEKRDISNSDSSEASEEDSLESENSADSDDIKSDIKYLKEELKKLSESEEKHKQELEKLKKKLEEEIKTQDQEKVLRKSLEKSRKEEVKSEKRAEHERKRQEKERKNGASESYPKNNQVVVSNDEESTKRFLLGRVPLLWPNYSPVLWNIPNPQSYGSSINNPSYTFPNPQLQNNLGSVLGPQRPGLPVNYPNNLLRPLPWNSWNTDLSNPNVNQQWQPSAVNYKPLSASENELPNSVLVVPQTPSEHSFTPEKIDLQGPELNRTSNNDKVPVPSNNPGFNQQDLNLFTRPLLKPDFSKPIEESFVVSSKPVPSSNATQNGIVFPIVQANSTNNDAQESTITGTQDSLLLNDDKVAVPSNNPEFSQQDPNLFTRPLLKPDVSKPIEESYVESSKPGLDVDYSLNQNPVPSSNTTQNSIASPIAEPNTTNIDEKASTITGTQDSLSDMQQSTLPLQNSSSSDYPEGTSATDDSNVSDIIVIPIQDPKTENNNSESITSINENNDLFNNNQSSLSSPQLKNNETANIYFMEDDPTNLFHDVNRKLNSSANVSDSKTTDSVQNLLNESNTSLIENSESKKTSETSVVRMKTSSTADNNLVTEILDTNAKNSTFVDSTQDNTTRIDKDTSNTVNNDVLSSDNTRDVVTDYNANSTLNTLSAPEVTQSDTSGTVNEINVSNNSTAYSPNKNIVPESDLISPDANAEIVEVVNEPSFSISEPPHSDSLYVNVTNSSSIADTPIVAA